MSEYKYETFEDFRKKFKKQYPEELMDVMEAGFIAARELKPRREFVETPSIMKGVMP